MKRVAERKLPDQVKAIAGLWRDAHVGQPTPGPASRMADEHADLFCVEGTVLAAGMPFAFDHACCVKRSERSGDRPTLLNGAA
ncbi:hypothetical protein [Nonomuraea ceibae]|uniref:hypothetical protein n=1 Tax=Nonomuraea ceibae TaxID=1935170 RepID=UPI001C5F565A|nr:hypothetical protein [Nonomuraea ceibae]